MSARGGRPSTPARRVITASREVGSCLFEAALGDQLARRGLGGRVQCHFDEQYIDGLRGRVFLIRSEQHFSQTALYIEWNPVKAGLCKVPDEWMYSSAFARSQRVSPN